MNFPVDLYFAAKEARTAAGEPYVRWGVMPSPFTKDSQPIIVVAATDQDAAWREAEVWLQAYRQHGKNTAKAAEAVHAYKLGAAA